MRVSKYDELVESNTATRTSIEAWITAIRIYQRDALDELYAGYKLLMGKKGDTKRQRKELTLFPSPNVILCTEDMVLIYLRPSDGIPCYGPDQSVWDITDKRLWPTSCQLKPVSNQCPPDVWRLLFVRLSIKDVFALACTCRQLCNLVHDERTWAERKKEFLNVSPHASWCFPKDTSTWQCFIELCKRRYYRYWKTNNMNAEQKRWACLYMELTFPFNKTNTPCTITKKNPGWITTDGVDAKYYIGRDAFYGVVMPKQKGMTILIHSWVDGMVYTFTDLRFMARPFHQLWHRHGSMLKGFTSSNSFDKDKVYLNAQKQ